VQHHGGCLCLSRPAHAGYYHPDSHSPGGIPDTDMTEVLEEAWGLVERDLIDELAFRRLTFTNTVALHGRMDPDFFKGSAVEEVAARELARTEPH
jgi:hypothetical protein